MERMPTLFVSHGAPTFAIDPGVAGPQLTALGTELPRPRAILIVSPHWTTRGLVVGSATTPETVHDFSGFPAQLYSLRYRASGDPELAARVVAMLAAHGHEVSVDAAHGLDHGVWVPLRFLYPAADVPVVQLSLPARFDALDAFKLGRLLSALSNECVLIVGSGSLTHNLSEIRASPAADDTEYVRRFVDWSRKAVTSGDTDSLVDYLSSAPDAQRAHPTPDHYLPLPFAAGAAPPGTRARVIDGGMTYGVLSMDSFVFAERH